ncbi:protein-glucosylgalactosylhydroxylysine glucosidase-like isoform X2 [Physella acuta]|uniref:protein-glucosylgalactosylhydroxylysine glucosidase-like isoform X2 n=1 Tax=Physella acuta TaxID=109671 RepID=UPI0027DD8199|nr:protein-glucosylgalactosylhydroxylysine glucosidase-like isoform X2 [Physella acuta]
MATFSIWKLGHSPLPATPLPEDATVFTSADMPKRGDYYPEVGNGHVATVVQSDTICMNGLYNGHNITSHRARLASPVGYSLTPARPTGLTRSYSLDVGRAIFSESYTAPGVDITLRTYAHRQLTAVLVNELVLSRDDVTQEVTVTTHLNTGQPSDDVKFLNDTPGFQHGQTLEAEYPEIAPPTDFYIKSTADLPPTVTLTPGVSSMTLLHLTAIDVKKEIVQAAFDQALSQFAQGTLLANHVSEWTKVWTNGRIDTKGDVSVARLNYASLYYILSSLPFNGSRPDWPFIGLSPGGLAHGVAGRDYNGHVFWDQDTWMFPPIALLHADLARTITETRLKTLDSARLLAQRTGYQGARYPWESAFTGLETCPAEPYGEMEIHINGDVTVMLRQFWQLTQDKDLMSRGAEVVWETAKFWSSRVTQNPDHTYSIQGVMPPDEYNYPVNDSAYTNSIASINLAFANTLAQVFGKPANQTWADISKNLRIPYDPDLDYHPEFEGYQPTTRTKQADVVLLDFPLMRDMAPSTRKNDLTIYEASTPVGPAPAMTWGMFLLGWLQLGNQSKASQLYDRAVLNAQQPFLVWSENSDGDGATNFLTGMGGYLQLVLFGYGGARIYDDHLTFDPVLITRTTEVTFTGLDYRGCSFDLSYSESNLTLTQTQVNAGHVGLKVKFADSAAWVSLTTGQPVLSKRQSLALMSVA